VRRARGSGQVGAASSWGFAAAPLGPARRELGTTPASQAAASARTWALYELAGNSAEPKRTTLLRLSAGTSRGRSGGHMRVLSYPLFVSIVADVPHRPSRKIRPFPDLQARVPNHGRRGGLTPSLALPSASTERRCPNGNRYADVPMLSAAIRRVAAEPPPKIAITRRPARISMRPGRLELPPRLHRTRPSTLRVYQFRHRRVDRSV
jgi:hypothetical protein